MDPREPSGGSRAMPLTEPDEMRGAEIAALNAEIDALRHEIEQRVAVETELRDELTARVAAERSTERLAQLQALSVALLETLTLYDVATIIVTRGVAAVGASGCSIGMLVEAGEVLEVLKTVGYPEETAAARRIPLTVQVPITEAARSGTPSFFDTLGAARARFPALRPVEPDQDHALVAAPLAVGKRVIGAVELIFDNAHHFDADERAFVLRVTRKCALALDRTRLYEASARARADADAANRDRNDFLSTISHELRTPLTAILGWANILRTQKLDSASGSRALAIIERNARTQAQLIEDILDVSRLTTGKLSLTFQPVDAEAVVRAAMDIVRPAAEEKGVRLEAAVDDELRSVSADRGRLQQITVNLLSNALKFTPKGGRIHVRLTQEPSALQLSVADTGKGIGASFLPHVFERFRQEAGGAQGGLGLGLAIVKHLVELHGGTIAAESEGEGLGAIFTIRFPVHPEEADEPEGQAAGERASPPFVRLDGVRVVVVDDNPDVRDMIASVLRDQGASVRVAESAVEAFRAVVEEKPDVLVSDIGMPDQDGYALLQRVHAVMAVPALALTAYAGPEDKKQAELAGFEMHMAKPVAPARLVAAVARLAGIPAPS